MLGDELVGLAEHDDAASGKKGQGAQVIEDIGERGVGTLVAGQSELRVGVAQEALGKLPGPVGSLTPVLAVNHIDGVNGVGFIGWLSFAGHDRNDFLTAGDRKSDAP